VEGRYITLVGSAVAAGNFQRAAAGKFERAAACNSERFASCKFKRAAYSVDRG
jgi:hypothetical protein